MHADQQSIVESLGEGGGFFNFIAVVFLPHYKKVFLKQDNWLFLCGISPDENISRPHKAQL